MVFRVWQIVPPLLILLLLGACSEKRTTDRPILNIPFLLEEGDIVVRRGKGIISEMVLFADSQSEYSHMGLLIQVDSQLVVVHTVPHEGEFDGIKQETVTEYFGYDKAAAGAIYRFPLTHEQQVGIRSYALEQLDRKLAFDHQYDLTQPDTQYCTEFIWNSFRSIGIDLSEERRTRLKLLPEIAGCLTPSNLYTNKACIPIFQWKE